MIAASEVFRGLLEAQTTEGVRDLLEGLGDSADVGLDEPFGSGNYVWRAYGDNASNLSTIGLATKAGRSLTERLTNAVDALLELRALAGVAQPRSPRLAAKQWFGRPVSGPDDGLFRWTFSEGNLDRLVHVVLRSSGSEIAPTVDVIDAGIGIKPDDFATTILSLQARNKISKFYLLGAFGQGGASTLAFCNYALIVSRHQDLRGIVGFTVVRVLSLSDRFKEDAYGYLCAKGANGTYEIPRVVVGTGPLDLGSTVPGVRLPSLDTGTMVRHIAYKLPQLSGTLGPSPGNLYHFLHCSLLDPLLPFRVIDVRDPARAKDELVTGSRNRLMRLASKVPTSTSSQDETGSEIRHYRPMEFITPLGSIDPCLGVEYWVLLSYRKGKGPKAEVTLRPHSNELFVQKGHPIVGTVNGQNQGEQTAQLLREIGLGMVSRHIVVHIDASLANSRVRRELFSTTREGFKEGDVLRELMRLVEKMLQEDETLYEIERELTERLAKREADSASDEVKRQVTKLLLEAGLQIKDPGPSVTPGGDEPQPVVKKRKGRHRVQDPLPTLPFPDVTKLKIVHPQPKLSVRVNDNEVVLVETDADAEFDRRGLLVVRSEPDFLEQAAKAPLRGGRVRWRFRPRPGVTVGATGVVVVVLTRPDGTQLSDIVPFETLPALEERAKKDQGQIPPFDIRAVHPEDNAQEWSTAWPDLSDEVTLEQQQSVAYKPVAIGGGIVVYYSKIFPPFLEQIEALKKQSDAMSELFRGQYEIWIAYHAILQENAKKKETHSNIDEEALEGLLEDDRVRVARMQVKQALKTADLMRKLMSESAHES